MTSRSRHPQYRFHTTRTNTTAKRKSAVEMLQESKAFYVKSKAVRDRKQELQPTRSPDNWTSVGQLTKSPRCSRTGTDLQDKLRLLLDLDYKENYDTRDRTTSMYRDNSPYKRTCDRGFVLSQNQHKSLPDLHMTPNHSSTETSESSYFEGIPGDARSTYSSNTQPEYNSLQTARSSEWRGYKPQDSYRHCEFTTADPRIYASLRVTKSGEFVSPRLTEAQTYCWRRNSNTSSGNRSQHNSSRHSQSADSGRQSQIGSGKLRTGRSGLPELSPPLRDNQSDSGAEDGSPPLYRSDTCEIKNRPILRSKSDISHRYTLKPNINITNIDYSTNNSNLNNSEQLERFFDHLGMDPIHYRQVSRANSRSSTPILFSSVSSLDSCLDLTNWTTNTVQDRINEPPSIVERNARIIKWLCDCRKAATVTNV